MNYYRLSVFRKARGRIWTEESWDLTILTGSFSGEHAYHNDSGTPPAEPYVWTGSSWKGYGPTSETTI